MGEERDSAPPPPPQRRRAAPPPEERPKTRVPLPSLGDGTRPPSRLHNFTFPSLSWGSQRLFRCAKVDPCGGIPPSDLGSTAAAEADDPRKKRRTMAAESATTGRAASGRERDRPGEIEEREEDERLVKLGDSMMAEFRKAFERIPLPSSSGSPPLEDKDVREPSTSAAGAEAWRPWNLRLRRAACNAPAGVTENGSQKARDRNQSPVPQEKNKKGMNCSRLVLRSEVDKERKERGPKFSSVLSKDEIAEDFFAMAGSKPPRRPKKRPRNVQKQIEMLYPGFYLCEVMPDLYRIPEDK